MPISGFGGVVLKKKFSDFVSDAKEAGNGGSGSNGGMGGTNGGFGSNGGAQGMNGAAFDMLKNIAGRYEGASESELISAILAEAMKSRAAGTLSDSEIDSFVAQISPMLTASQRSRLNAVVAKIKKT